MKTIFLSEINNLYSEKGMSLVSVILIITALTSLIVVMAGFGLTNSRRNALQAGNGKAFYLAESGIQYALQRSIDLCEWNWSQSGNYSDGVVTVSVSPQNGDEIVIKSRSVIGNTAKSNTLWLNVINPLIYSVFISGELIGNIGYDSIERLHFGVATLPDMNLDSLKQVAISQRNYYDKNITINNHSDNFEFWSNSYDHNQDATVIYTEKNLTIDKTNKQIGAIFVVIGDLILKDSKDIEGIFYLANNYSTQSVSCQTKKSQNCTLSGAIIGNTDIYSTDDRRGPKLSVYYNPIFVEKFYSYSLTNSAIIKKVSWMVNY